MLTTAHKCSLVCLLSTPNGAEHLTPCLMPELSWLGSDCSLMPLLLLHCIPHASDRHSLLVYVFCSGTQSTLHALCIMYHASMHHVSYTIGVQCMIQPTSFTVQHIASALPHAYGEHSAYGFLQFIVGAQDKHTDHSLMLAFAHSFSKPSQHDHLQSMPCS